DDLVHGAVAADRDQIALALLKSLAGGLGGVTGMRGADNAVGEVGLVQHAFDAGQRLVDGAAAGVGVGDEHERAEWTGHGLKAFGFMMPAGSRAALMVSRRPSPVSPSSAPRNGALRRPTPWWWVMVPPASVQLRAACCQASRYLSSASWSSAPMIMNVKYSDEPDGYRWDRWQATAWACADRAVLMPP